MRLNIGCGKQHLPQFVNIDRSDFCKPDLQIDITEGLPYEDNSVDEIIANGILEMIHANESFKNTLNDLWRVLKSDGRLNGQVPSTDPRVLGLDPFDKRWFLEDTFKYWNHREHSYEEFGTQYGFKPWVVHFAIRNDNGIINFSMSPWK